VTARMEQNSCLEMDPGCCCAARPRNAAAFVWEAASDAGRQGWRKKASTVILTTDERVRKKFEEKFVHLRLTYGVFVAVLLVHDNARDTWLPGDAAESGQEIQRSAKSWKS